MANESITCIPVAQDRFDLWGITVNDYMYNGKQVDFESILVGISAQRATTIEQQVTPLSTQVKLRNKDLRDLGNTLAALTAVQTSFDKDAGGGDTSTEKVSQADVTLLDKLSMEVYKTKSGVNSNGTMTKSTCEKCIQMVKTEMDKLNNDAQADMTRLQSLVTKRDDAFTQASDVMGNVSDTRTNAIKAMGS